MTAHMLRRLEAPGDLIVEGGFARSPAFAAVLARLMGHRRVVIAPTSAGAAAGAAMLAHWDEPHPPPRLEPALVWDLPGLEAYRARGSERFRPRRSASTPSCNLPAAMSFPVRDNAGRIERGIVMSATSTHSSEEISTLIPARLERLPWGRFHVLVIAALGITWILDGLEVTLAGSVAAGFERQPGASFLRFRGWIGRQRLSSRRGRGRAVLWMADRPARTQKAVFHHHRCLPYRDGAHRPRVERLHLLPVSLLHRLRHRGRIFRHQLDHPGTGPGALPGPTRSHDQRQFLGRRGAGRRWSRSCSSIRRSSLQSGDGALRS